MTMKAIKALVLVFMLSLAGAGLEASATTVVKTNKVENTNQKKKPTKKKKRSTKKRSKTLICDCDVCSDQNGYDGYRCRNKGRVMYCKSCRQKHVRCNECRVWEDGGCGCDGDCRN